MKTITTIHKEIGYTNNVEIIEEGLKRFGINDHSYMQKAIAAHVWSYICGNGSEEKTWGETEIRAALDYCQVRLNNARKELDLVTDLYKMGYFQEKV